MSDDGAFDGGASGGGASGGGASSGGVSGNGGGGDGGRRHGVEEAECEGSGSSRRGQRRVRMWRVCGGRARKAAGRRHT